MIQVITSINELSKSWVTYARTCMSLTWQYISWSTEYHVLVTILFYFITATGNVGNIQLSLNNYCDMKNYWSNLELFDNDDLEISMLC